MKERESRTEMLVGSDAMERLRRARVIVFGMGGVGSWAAETLVRTGIGHVTIVDFDRVAESNINRQMPATTATVGRLKTEVMAEHLRLVNPDAEIVAVNELYTEQTADDFDLDSYDYVIDAIDSLRDKVLLIYRTTRAHTRLYSSMGAALKTDPLRIRVSDFDRVKGCRLAAALRQRIKRTQQWPGRKFKCVWSEEIRENAIAQPPSEEASPIHKAVTNGSLMQVTAVFGITLASLVINHITN